MVQRSHRKVVLLIAGAALVAAIAGFWLIRPPGDGVWTGSPRKLTVEIPAIEMEPGRWRILAASRDAFVRDKQRLNAQVTLRPATGAEPGSITELRIVRLAADSPLFSAGLRVDDVIREVNGTPVNSMNRAVNLANEIGSSSRVTAKVDRAGRILLYDLVFE